MAQVAKDGWFDESPKTAPAPSPAAASSLAPTTSTRVKAFSCDAPPAKLATALRAAVADTGGEACAKKAVDDDEEAPGPGTVEATKKSASGLLSMVASVKAAGAGSTLDVLRGKGDILAFAAWQQAVVEALAGAGCALVDA